MDTQEQNPNDTTDAVEAKRLPLWKGVLEEMINDGVTYGTVYPADYFERGLKAKRDSMSYGIGLSEIRKHLEWRGLYLSGRGLNESEYIVVPPENNLAQGRSHTRQGLTLLTRAWVLLSNTPLELLQNGHRAAHEAATEKAAKRLALLGRRMPQPKALT